MGVHLPPLPACLRLAAIPREAALARPLTQCAPWRASPFGPPPHRSICLVRRADCDSSFVSLRLHGHVLHRAAVAPSLQHRAQQLGQLRRGGTLAANRPGARQRLTNPPSDSRCDKGNRADRRGPPVLLDSAGAVLCSALRDVLLSAIANVVVLKEQHSMVPSAPCPGRVQIE
jgi:hypothetical protein